MSVLASPLGVGLTPPFASLAPPLTVPRTSNPFSPLNISGLLCWYDASRITGLTNGQSVNSWSDLSGNSHNLGPGGSVSPTYASAGNGLGSRAAVHFTPSDASHLQWLMTATALNPALPFTQAVALRSTTVGVIGVAGANSSLGMQSWADTAWRITDTTNLGGGTYDQNSHAFIGIFNGASSSIYLDNIQVASGTAGASGFGNAAYQVGIGFDGSINRGMTGFIGEVLLYTHALTTTELGQIHTYFRYKWGTP